MAGASLCEERGLCGTVPCALRATVLETATRQRVQRTRSLARMNNPFAGSLDFGIRHGNGRKQRLGVRVSRLFVEIIAAGDFHEYTGVHNGDAVGDVPHHRKIVGNEKIGDAKVPLQILQQVHDLGADRDV